MNCKYCGVPLLDDEIQFGMCCKCPQYCETCREVLPWERFVCTHESEKLFHGKVLTFPIKHSFCMDCGLKHVEKEHGGYEPANR